MGHDLFLFAPRFTRKQQSWLISLTALAFLLRLYRLEVQSLWFDESLSALFASQPLDIAVQSMLQEGLHHSPFYYLLLRPFAMGGFSEFSLRFLSAILGVLAVPLMAHLGRFMANTRVGLLAAVLLTINPFHIWYSQEARMYTLIIVVALGAMIFFSRSWQSPRLGHWVGLVICTAIGINTHYFAFFIPLLQFIFIIVTLKQNYALLRPWVGAQLLTGLLFIPWIAVMLNWGKFYFGSAALQPATGYDLVQTFWNFSIGYTEQITAFVVITLSLCLLLFILGIKSTYQTNNGLLLWLWALIPPGLAFLMSFRLPMYMDRYISLSLPPFLLLIAIGINCIRSKVGGLIITGIIFGAMMGGLSRVYYDSNIYYRADWRSLGAYLEKESDPGDVIALSKYQILLSLFFYYHGLTPLEPITVSDQINLPYLSAQPSVAKVWLVFDYPNDSAHLVGHCQAFDIDKLDLSPVFKEWWVKHQDRLIEVKKFPCLRLELYQ